ncbi:MAG: asparagine synthase (glutamine-hydrolyzing) [Rhodospirillaceae bacterium]|nr:asparagine synthase (glutamine-hydrolyzing) [Rhodospirillaceae bacterium]
MCGIAGLITKSGQDPDRAVLERMARALAHRGPDGQAVTIAAGVGLVHTRLAIVDLQTGAQPLTADDGTSLIANAEIYNDLAIRAELGSAAYATGSDCESALHMYRRHGATFADKLRGMYAIAIHDPRQDRVVLARDPFGIKPVYYAETEQAFCFASEPQALIAGGLVVPKVNTKARDEVLGLQFTTGAETIFSGIQRVMPGETLVIARGRVVERCVVDALPDASAAAESELASLKTFDEAWFDSINVHRRADVPYGMFLSGGIDSSAVLAMMARQDRRAVLAYTAAFPGTDAHDEREQARIVARALGAEHIEIEVTAKDFWQHLPRIAAAMDDPAADYAVIPSYLLASRAKHEVKVVLTGEGGDELFAGYGRYRGALRPWPFTKTPRRRSPFDGLGVLSSHAHWRAGLDEIEHHASHKDYDKLQALQAADMAAWLPNDLLIKLDRCLMAHGLEGRVPFLDSAVARIAFPLAPKLKIRKGLGKWLLRRWLADAAPSASPYARKRGFSVPVGDWMAQDNARLGPLLARHPALAEICDPRAVEALFADPGAKHAEARWRLLFYTLWHNRHILGHDVSGGILDVLSANS